MGSSSPGRGTGRGTGRSPRDAREGGPGGGGGDGRGERGMGRVEGGVGGHGGGGTADDKWSKLEATMGTGPPPAAAAAVAEGSPRQAYVPPHLRGKGQKPCVGPGGPSGGFSGGPSGGPGGGLSEPSRPATVPLAPGEVLTAARAASVRNSVA